MYQLLQHYELAGQVCLSCTIHALNRTQLCLHKPRTMLAVLQCPPKNILRTHIKPVAEKGMKTSFLGSLGFIYPKMP